MEQNEQSTVSDLYISEDVISKVIKQAAESVKGVQRVVGRNGRVSSGRRLPGIRIRLDGDAIYVSVNVMLCADAPAAKTAEDIQSSIKDAVQNILGMTAARINVTVADVEVRR